MGLFGKFFEKPVYEQLSKASSMMIAGGTNPTYEKLLKEHFGLSHSEGGWEFFGMVVNNANIIAQLSAPGDSVDFLKTIMKKNPFDTVCILYGETPLIICNTGKPPTGFCCGLDSSGCLSLSAMLSSRGGGKVYTYRGLLTVKF
jgi:hypothetical protein